MYIYIYEEEVRNNGKKQEEKNQDLYTYMFIDIYR